LASIPSYWLPESLVFSGDHGHESISAGGEPMELHYTIEQRNGSNELWWRSQVNVQLVPIRPARTS
jgi:hypothetical protein